MRSIRRARNLLLTEGQVVDPKLDIDVRAAEDFPVEPQVTPSSSHPFLAVRVGAGEVPLVDGYAIDLGHEGGVGTAGVLELPLHAHPFTAGPRCFRVQAVVGRIADELEHAALTADRPFGLPAVLAGDEVPM